MEISLSDTFLLPQRVNNMVIVLRREPLVDQPAADVLEVRASLHAVKLVRLAEVLNDILDGLVAPPLRPRPDFPELVLGPAFMEVEEMLAMAFALPPAPWLSEHRRPDGHRLALDLGKEF